MGFFKKMIEKFNEGFFYVVDINTLRDYINEDLEITLDQKLEAGAHLNIYYKGDKHEIQVWNYAASDFQDEKEKGLIVYYDKIEYKSVEELFDNAIISNTKLKDIKEFFKIELIDMDSNYFKEYQKKHPELKVEDYN